LNLYEASCTHPALIYVAKETPHGQSFTEIADCLPFLPVRFFSCFCAARYAPSIMLFKALSTAVYGITNLIDVEVDYSGAVANEDHFNTVGLPNAAVHESRAR
jgi:hypothetical protein